MKKKYIVIMVIVILALVLSVLGIKKLKENSNKKQYEVNEPVEIVWWNTLDSQYDDYVNEIIKKFNSSQKNITVKSQYIGNWSDLNEALAAANAAGTGLPAITDCNTKFIAAYANNNLFENLDDYIKATKYDTSDFIEGIYSIGTFNNKQVAMPFLHSTQVIYYNKSLAQKEKINYDGKFENLDVLFNEIRNKLNIIPLSMQSLDFYYGTIYRNAGVKIINDRESDLNSKQSIDITNKIKNWTENNMISWLQGNDASTNMKQSFYNQKSFAMLHNSTSLLTHIKKSNFEVGIAWYPSVNGNANADLGGGVLAIPSKNSQQIKNAAWEFMKFLCSEELNADWVIKTGNLPTRKFALNSEKLKNYLKQYPEYQVLYNNLEKIYPPLINESASQIVKIWQNYMNKIMLQKSDTNEMLEEAVKEIDEILNEQ